MKTPIEFKDNKLLAGIDSNNDGENSVSVTLCLSEALQEVMAKKGEAKIEGQVVSLKMEGAQIKVAVDTDKDGENLLEVNFDMPESFDEVSSAFAKKK